MKQKYFYDQLESECYNYDNIYDAFDAAVDDAYQSDQKIFIIEEMVISKKSHERFCSFDLEFIDTGIYGDCEGCNNKKFIGKSHICEHLSWGLIETEAKWEYNTDDNKEVDGVMEIDYSKIKKISGRTKK